MSTRYLTQFDLNKCGIEKLLSLQLEFRQRLQVAVDTREALQDVIDERELSITYERVYNRNPHDELEEVKEDICHLLCLLGCIRKLLREKRSTEFVVGDYVIPYLDGDKN